MARLSRLVAGIALAAATLVLPALDASAAGTYTVRAGDTLSGIAATLGVPLDDLLAVNGLTLTSLIVPGQELAVPDSATASGSGVAGPVGSVLDFALAQVGKPYTFFSAGPGSFDCSGLSMAAYAQVGVSLVHHSATQALQGQAVDYWNGPIGAGDLVFLDSDWDGAIDHVGIALGPYTWIQASQSRDAVVTGPLPPKSVIVAVRRMF